MLAPIVRGRKGEFKKELEAFKARGFTQARIDGQFRVARGRHQARTPQEPHDRGRRRSADRPLGHRTPADRVDRNRAHSSPNEIVVINSLDEGDRLFSRRLACVTCGISVPEMSPRAFSFNSPHGACPACQGLGATWDFDPARDRAGSVAVAGRRRHRAVERAAIRKLVRDALETLVGDLRHRARRAVCEAAEEAARPAAVRSVGRGGRRRIGARAEDSGREAKRRRPSRSGETSRASCRTCAAATSEGTWTRAGGAGAATARCATCPACHGERLKPESRAVRVKGRTIAGLRRTCRSPRRCDVFDALELTRSRVDHRRAHPAARSRIACASSTTSASAT